MKRSTQRRSTRWSDKARSNTPRTEDVKYTPLADLRDRGAPVLGPYEATYDVSHGYSLDRSIVVP